MGRKNKSIIVIFGLFLLVVSFFVFKKYHKPAVYKDYEALVAVRDMGGSYSSEAERARSAMSAGSVIVIKEGAGNWSATERVSYLVVKLRLTEEQAGNLTSPETRKLTGKEKDAELTKMKEGNANISKEELQRFEEELDNRTETVRARKYILDLKKVLPAGFRADDLMNGQPVAEMVFGWKEVSGN